MGTRMAKAPVTSALYVIALLMLSPTSSLAQQSCDAPASWTSFQSVPSPDHSIAPISNCAFHVWAWQTFIWMMQPGIDGRSRFLGFPTVAETFAPAGDSPAVFVAPAAARVLTLMPRAIKSSDPFGSIVQAGEKGMLIDRNGRSVYYSVNVDRVFYEFIREKKYYDPTVFENADPTQNFPVGALEFKYSWRIVGEGENASGFFAVPAEVVLLVERDGKVVLDPAGATQKVTAALVGVHVVGIVKDHPEFIWATFEHQDNAPDLPAGMAFNSPDAVSNRDWLFYKAGTAANLSNQPNLSIAKLTDPAKQTLTPITNVFRRFPWGSQPSNQTNADNIVALNASVRGRVLSSDPVWQKYQLIGGTWLAPNSLQPGEVPAGKAVASTRLSNATMETFTQSASANCFSCHRTIEESRDGVTIGAKNLNLSHVLLDAYFRARKAETVAKFR